MDSSRYTFDLIQKRMADAVATSQERTPEKQRALLAELLAIAYETTSQPATV